MTEKILQIVLDFLILAFFQAFQNLDIDSFVKILTSLAIFTTAIVRLFLLLKGIKRDKNNETRKND